MQILKEPRNKAIVYLNKLEPETFSFQVIGDLLGIAKQTAHEIYERDKGKYLVHKRQQP